MAPTPRPPSSPPDVSATTLYRTLFPSLFDQLCRTPCFRRAPDEAHDALQAAFEALLERQSRTRFLPDHPERWLLQVAKNQGKRARSSRSPALSLDSPRTAADDDMAPLLEALPDPRLRRPISELVERERSTVARNALESLPEESRSVVDRHLFQDIPFPRIAAELGREEETVKKTFQRALKKIHEALGRYSSTCIPEGGPETYLPHSRQGLRKIIRTLPIEYARLLEASCDHLLPLEQIAAEEGLSIEEVRKRLHRADELMQKKYRLTSRDLSRKLHATPEGSRRNG